MMKLCYLIFFFAALSCKVYSQTDNGEDWVLYYENSINETIENKYYFDSHSIHKKGDYVTVWEKAIPVKTLMDYNGKEILYTLTHYRIYPKSGTYRILRTDVHYMDRSKETIKGTSDIYKTQSTARLLDLKKIVEN
jgi:hypothetical protein